MVYLILAVLSSTLVSVIMRTSEKRVRNNISMIALNYLMCIALAVLYTGLRLPEGPGGGFAIGLGAINSILYVGSLLLLQWNIRENGVVLPATFMKLGVLVPTIMAAVFFHEMPTWIQTVGIVAAIAAIVMIQGKKGEGGAKKGWGLLLLLLDGGAADAMAKIYEEWGQPAFADYFLLFTFAFALALCVLLCIIKKQRLTPVDAAFGLLIGIPNYFSSRFLLLSLANVPAVVAYPTYSIGTIVMVTLIGVVVFGERLSRRQIAAVCLILMALVLLNLP